MLAGDHNTPKPHTIPNGQDAILSYGRGDLNKGRLMNDRPDLRDSAQEDTSSRETSSGQFDHVPTGAARPEADLILPVTVGERYRLDELRGSGGMAKVYKATDLRLDRIVAVKIIHPEIRNQDEFDRRFRQEAVTVSKLSDPHIVSVYDYGIDEEHGPYLVMEFLEGESLRERLANQGPLPYRAGLQIAGHILLALIHAHEKEVIHRDIKPDNIFLASQSGVRLHARVVDFGIARIPQKDEDARITLPGTTPGTPKYMAPEQLGGSNVDARTDLYSAAYVMYELFTGQSPFGGPAVSKVCADAPPSLDTLLKECLSSDPNDRPSSALEVYLRIQELGKASGVLLLPPGSLDKLVMARQSMPDEPTLPYEKTSPQGKGNALLWIGALILLLGLAAAAWWLFLK